MNDYIHDSGLYFKDISKRINNNIADFEIINLTMNLAIGLEKFLKGLLFDINPTYILIEPVFKNSVQILYKEVLLKGKDISTDLTKNPNGDVITFRNSVLRTQCVSKTTYENKNILFMLSDARDIIAHCKLKHLDLAKYKQLLLRDFYPLLKAYSIETNIKRGHFFSGSHIRLVNISSKLQETLESEISLLLDAHLEKWKSLKGIAQFVEQKDKITYEISETPNKEIVICPACENESVLYLKPIYEFNPSNGEEILIGNEIKKLKCQYCKLEIVDSKKLDYLDIKGPKINPLSTCSRCGEILDTDNATGFCEKCENYYGTEN